MRSCNLLWALALPLGACGQGAPQPGNQQSVTEKSAAASAVANSNSTSEPASLNGASTALENGPVQSFVGVWATSQASCSTEPWRFTAHDLNAKGGPRCTFYQVTKMHDGYDIGAQCPTKKPVPTDLIKLRFGQSAGAMLIESNALPPTGLVSCKK